jgi:hypothetical protein
VPAAQLPLLHSIPLHGTPADISPSALIDSLRAVRVNYRTTDGGPGVKERIYSTTRTIALPNAGMRILRACGSVPLLGGAIAFASNRVVVSGAPISRLTWNPSVDETAGERDVVRYVIYRSIGVPGPWTEPYVSLGTGSVNYQWDDTNVAVGQTYYYAIAAQDCTPSLSSILAAPNPVVP